MVPYLGFLCPISRSKFLLFTTSDFHSVSKQNDKKVEEETLRSQLLKIPLNQSVLGYTSGNTVYINVCDSLYCYLDPSS